MPRKARSTKADAYPSESLNASQEGSIGPEMGRRSGGPESGTPPVLPGAILAAENLDGAGTPVSAVASALRKAKKGHAARRGQGLEREQAESRNASVTDESGKVRRGRRYRTLESVRRGMAKVANELEHGTVDARTAAVRVQALQGIANVIQAQEAARLEAASAEIERRTAELHAAEADRGVGHS